MLPWLKPQPTTTNLHLQRLEPQNPTFFILNLHQICCHCQLCFLPCLLLLFPQNIRLGFQIISYLHGFSRKSKCYSQYFRTKFNQKSKAKEKRKSRLWHWRLFFFGLEILPGMEMSLGKKVGRKFICTYLDLYGISNFLICMVSSSFFGAKLSIYISKHSSFKAVY